MSKIIEIGYLYLSLNEAMGFLSIQLQLQTYFPK